MTIYSSSEVGGLYNTSSSVSSQNKSCTIAADVSYAVVLVNKTSQISSITIGGVECVHIATVGGVSAWALLGPPTGTVTATITFLSPQNLFTWRLFFFSRCKACALAGSTTLAGGESSVSTSVLCADDSDMYLDIVRETYLSSTTSGNLTENVAQTEPISESDMYNIVGSTSYYTQTVGASYKPSDVDSSMSWTFSKAATGGSHLVLRLIPHNPFTARGTIIQ